MTQPINKPESDPTVLLRQAEAIIREAQAWGVLHDRMMDEVDARLDAGNAAGARMLLNTATVVLKYADDRLTDGTKILTAVKQSRELADPKPVDWFESPEELEQ